ncbi:MAG: hypothetical protein LBG95_02830 [Treponema sp.]|jgi:hypothetical protein|nr:hypothetical protein [Treponema sp.]
MMVQIYFLSIVFNGLAGFLFIFGDSGEGNSAENTNRRLSFVGDGFRLILGILTAITGILKLLLPMPPRIPILGDFVPAIAGIAAGFMLIYGFYRDRSSESIDSQEKINHFAEIFLRHRKMAGIILLACAALHFLFPNAFFL